MLHSWHVPHQLYFQPVFLKKWITLSLCVYSSSVWYIFNPLTLFISVTQSSNKFLQVSGRQVRERRRLLISSLGERLRRESFWEREFFNSLALIKASLGICFRSDNHESHHRHKSIGNQAALALLHTQLLSLANCENFAPPKDYLSLVSRVSLLCSSNSLRSSHDIFSLGVPAVEDYVSLTMSPAVLSYSAAAQLDQCSFSYSCNEVSCISFKVVIF